MTRNLKALGLALVAVFAMSALVASSASAVVEHPGKLDFTTGTGPFKLVAHQVEGEKHKFVLTDDNNVTTECTTATFEGTTEDTQSTITVHPKYENCTAAGFGATVNTEGCNYTFHIGGTVGTEGHYGGTATLVNNECKIVITAATCQVTVDGEQTLSSITGINMKTEFNEKGEQTSDEDVTIKAEVKGINYTVTNDGFLCPLINGKVSGTEGDYTGNTTLTAFDSEGKQVEHQIEMGEITP